MQLLGDNPLLSIWKALQSYAKRHKQNRPAKTTTIHNNETNKKKSCKFQLDHRIYNSFVHSGYTDVLTMGNRKMQNTYQKIAQSILWIYTQLPLEDIPFQLRNERRSLTAFHTSRPDAQSKLGGNRFLFCILCLKCPPGFLFSVMNLLDGPQTAGVTQVS